MKRALWCLSLGLLLAPHALPQENETGRKAATEGPEEANADPWIWWKWANFLILAGGLGYLVNKNAGGYFRSQKEEIERGIIESAKMKKEAEARAAVIEQRLNGLQAEIEGLRSQASKEMTAEGERIRKETERNVERLQVQAQQELELMTKSARHELKVYAADLALGLAEQRVRAGMNKSTQEALVNGFLRELNDGAGRRPVSQ